MALDLVVRAVPGATVSHGAVSKQSRLEQSGAASDTADAGLPLKGGAVVARLHPLSAPRALLTGRAVVWAADALE